jgi:pimeloyl-ACP methyl ester carboxylesterase
MSEALMSGMMSKAVTSYDGDDQTMDGCYPAVFNRAINGTGVLSRRHVYREALDYLVKNGDTAPFDQEPLFRGPLSWLGWILTSSGAALVRARKFKRAKAALHGAIQQDFHLGHSYRRDGMQHSYGATTRHWRWRGVLTDFVCVEDGAMTRPAIVLVHGFGAFGEHWRRNVRDLADLGYDVYAPTFPGYGRSEKMSMQYGQDLWRDFLADFVSDIVERPVVICGNSIGGYIAASVAADFPHLIKGLVLLNSAGQVNVDFSPKQYEVDLVENPRQPPPVVVVDAISTLLFSFLEGDIENQLQRLYPTRPENADEWLGKEIRRASQDPKALGVFRSVFFLPSPRPLNYLINELYQGPVLVLQGILDPLNDATKRAEQIVAACPQTELRLLEAGHCAHDEIPDLVNDSIARFAAKCFA